MTAPITRTLAVAVLALAGLLTLLTLAGSAGLGPPGWLAAAAFAAAGWAVLAEAAPRYGMTRFGPADLVNETVRGAARNAAAELSEALRRSAHDLDAVRARATVVLAWVDTWMDCRAVESFSFEPAPPG